MQTKLIRSHYNLKTRHQGGVVTIGNFDGVHLGHQQLIARTIEAAKERGTHSLVVTFEPHPFEFFSREQVTIPRLTRLREKFAALSDCGVDFVLILPFNQDVASLSASDFVTHILHEHLHPAHMVIGDDFRFGHQRQGDFGMLKQMGNQLGFDVESLPTYLVEGERVSSTSVRKALAEDNLELASALLGHPYTMLGRVRNGDQLGRQLNCPTANIFLHRRLTPVKGIYTVYMHGIADHPLPGVANVGTRPTVDGTRTLLEVHLLNFNQDIYGRYVSVEFCEKLREEVRYPNLTLLKEQMARDIEEARHYFQKQGVL
jgi:riboflavin kinase/FMN adenylyltransferase